jgi:hypothetical protein
MHQEAVVRSAETRKLLVTIALLVGLVDFCFIIRGLLLLGVVAGNKTNVTKNNTSLDIVPLSEYFAVFYCLFLEIIPLSCILTWFLKLPTDIEHVEDCINE